MSWWDRIVRWLTYSGSPCPKQTAVDRLGRNRGHVWYPGSWGDNVCTLCGQEGWIEYGR